MQKQGATSPQGRPSLLLPQMSSAAASDAVRGSGSVVAYDARLEKAEASRRQQGLASDTATACGSPSLGAGLERKDGKRAGSPRPRRREPARSTTDGMLEGDAEDINQRVCMASMLLAAACTSRAVCLVQREALAPQCAELSRGRLCR